MHDTREFPYEYGSDLHKLWGWGDRLRDAVRDPDWPPGPGSWPLVFRPDRSAAGALTTLGAAHPAVIHQVLDYLAFAEEQFRIADDDAEAAMIDAFADLADRILTAAEAIAADNASSDPKFSSKHYAPAELRKMFDCSQETLKRRLDIQDIRNVKLTTKAYRVHVDDLPK